MVSVSYDNYGNNGGGGSRSYFGKQQVSLPYKPEVFIPPIQRQEDLVPLSRLPPETGFTLLQIRSYRM